MKTLLLPALALISLLSTGCNNECQQLCNEIGSYWDECGISYKSSQVGDCRKAFAGHSEEVGADGLNNYERYRGSCTQLIGTVTNDEGQQVVGLRERFTCKDMEDGPGGAFAQSR